MDLTPSTPQTSSESSNDPQVSTETDEGSECGWRDNVEGARAIFYMGDDDQTKYPQGFHRNLEGQKIRVGICAMAKKTNSKPMKEILGRLERFEHLQISIFDEDMIKSAPVEEWPVVDALVSFFSAGFPLQKAIQYKNLHKPFVVNDLEAQYTLKDRREVYKILVREGIAHPRYAVMNRDTEDKGEFEENEDAIEVNGVTFQRPFVEKPVNAEDHNIYIYFPISAGGGCQRLFRKVGSRSSVYSSISRVRKTGSYIYEDFMPTDGTDVKVYTVGPDYAHAEARKSPALDGKVERDKDGKEVRYPVILSAAEKLTARKVCTAFKNVCGFDLLRTGGKSYVCDVNGFSFVKNSTKYYDDCANVLGTMIVRALAPQLHIPLVLGAAPEDIPVVPTTSGSMMELRCVVAVIRHGDRTPKQKMKMEVKHRKFFELFEKYDGYKKGHLKLKKPKQLQEVLDIARDLLSESRSEVNPDVQEKKAKLRQLKLVLEMYEFSGINRKIQLKYQPYGRPPESSDDDLPKESSLVLIVKWGGELTPAGKFQAEDLGKAFRTLYPGGQGEFETPGLGFLRLHSTFRHDLKIYASDEGRVQMTAAAFTKGLLALEGELTPILVSMVKSANTNGLLDKEGETSKYQHVVKERMMDILNQDKGFTEEDYQRLVTTRSTSLMNAVRFIKNPKLMCDQVFEMVQEITEKIKTLKMELKSRDLKLYHGESWELLIRRWAKLEKDFKLKTGIYDISKVPDIYDCIKYDLQHNQKTLLFERAEELFTVSKSLADIVIPQEYGITVEEKLHISQSICTPLMRKIHSDLFVGCQGSDEESTRLNSQYSKGVASPERFVRTRLYFTSESHIHSLLNMLRYGGLCDEMKDDQWKKAMDFLSNTPELNYMTQINIMMFEDPTKEVSSPERFHIELHFSPGAYTSSDTSVVNPVSSGYRTSFPARQAKQHVKKLGADKDVPKAEDALKIEGVIKEVIAEESITEEMSISDTSDGPKNESYPNCKASDNGTKADVDSNTTDKSTDTDSKDPVEENIVEGIIIENENGKVTDTISTKEEFSEDSIRPSEAEEPMVCVKDLTKNKSNDTITSSETEGLVIETVDTNPTQAAELKTKECTSVAASDVESIEIDALNNFRTCDTENLNKNIKIENLDTISKGVECNLESVENICKIATNKADTKDKVAPIKTSVNVEESKSSESKIDNADEEVQFDELFDDEHSNTITDEKELVVKKKYVPQPRSPDPNIPEWDWDDNSHTEGTQSSDTTLKGCASGEKPVTSSPDISKSPKSVSQPITITQVSPIKERKRTGSMGFESVKSYEEKRSRSLEDHEDGENCIALMDKHYRTIHLPINKDNHHSFSSLLYLNPEAFKDFKLPNKYMVGSSSAPTLCCSLDSDNSGDSSAFDGFNMVPSLKPLETLHNNLTMRDLDAFLSRATTTKFFTPVSSPMFGPTPLPSPRCPESSKAKSTSGPSLPSSSNSSAGPSSPTTASTPVDFMTKLKMFISRAKTEPTEAETEPESPVSQQLSPNQTSQTSHVTQTDKNSSQLTGKPTEPIQVPTNAGHQSAFRTVARSSNQKSSFHVTQVSEDSLKLNNPSKCETEPKTGHCDNSVKSETEKKTAEYEKSIPVKSEPEVRTVECEKTVVKKDS